MVSVPNNPGSSLNVRTARCYFFPFQFFSLSHLVIFTAVNNTGSTPTHAQPIVFSFPSNFFPFLIFTTCLFLLICILFYFIVYLVLLFIYLFIIITIVFFLLVHIIIIIHLFYFILLYVFFLQKYIFSGGVLETASLSFLDRGKDCVNPTFSRPHFSGSGLHGICCCCCKDSQTLT